MQGIVAETGGVNLSGTEWELAKLIGDYTRFVEGVQIQLTSIDNSLKEGNTRMSAIEAKQAQNNTCLFHADVISIIEKQKEKDEEHNKAIGDLKTEAAVVEARLSPSEKRQLNIASLSGVGSVTIWVITYVLKIVFHINL